MWRAEHWAVRRVSTKAASWVVLWVVSMADSMVWRRAVMLVEKKAEKKVAQTAGHWVEQWAGLKVAKWVAYSAEHWVVSTVVW